MLGGSLSSFSRYEIYVLLLGAAAVLVAWPAAVNGWLRAADARRITGFCLGLMFLFSGYVFRTVDAVSAAGNVHDQQRQMQRFITEHWRAPYAANHPGWVNWRNPWPMLDLSGLASEPARAGAASGAPDWAGALVRERGIDLAMLYDNALPAPGAGWQRVGRLRLRARAVTVVGPSVTFWATRPEAVAPIRAALAGLAPELPPGAILEGVAVP